MVQIIPQDVGHAARFVQSFAPAFSQGFGDMSSTILQRQANADFAKQAADLLPPEMQQFGDILQAMALTNQPVDISRFLSTMMQQQAFGEGGGGHPQPKPQPEPEGQPNVPGGVPMEQPDVPRTPSGMFIGPNPGQQPPPGIPSPAYGQPQNRNLHNQYAQQDYNLGNQGKLSPEEYKKGAIVNPQLAQQIQNEARDSLQDPQREILAEQATDDQILNSFNDYFANRQIPEDSSDRNMLLNYYKDHFEDLDMPMSKKTRLAQQSFDQYLDTRNEFSDKLQRSKSVQYFGDVEDRQKPSLRRTTRMIMEMGDQGTFYEKVNEAGLSPIAAEDLVNPIREPLKEKMTSLPRLNPQKYMRKGVDMKQMSRYLEEVDKSTNDLSEFMLGNLRGTDSLLLLAEDWRKNHNGSIDGFNKAINQAMDNGLELSDYQTKQLTQLAENPFLNRLYDTGSVFRAFFGR